MLGYVGEDFSIVPVIYPRGTVSVLSQGCFSSDCYSYKPSHPYFPFSIGARHIQ